MISTRKRGFRLLLCLLLPLAFHITAAETAPAAEPPPQPFTVELLDLLRGKWAFKQLLGSAIEYNAPVRIYAQAAAVAGPVRIGCLCSDPEFPDDPKHGEWKIIPPETNAADSMKFTIGEPYFQTEITLTRQPHGIFLGELRNTRLFSAAAGRPYIAALCLIQDGRAFPFRLEANQESGQPQIKLCTDRVGNVFAGDEPVDVLYLAFNLRRTESLKHRFRVIDYNTRREVAAFEASAEAAPGKEVRLAIPIPLERYGIFEIVPVGDDNIRPLRICRIPAPREIDSEDSFIGMNIFQQQVWWYAYQVPLLAKAGVKWIRPWLAWENTWRSQEPVKGQWDTASLDATLRRMGKFGQEYACILYGLPSWLASDSARLDAGQLEQWSRYVSRLVKQYRGRIKYYEVWNEPDLTWPNGSDSAGPRYYAELLKVTHAAIKEADPSCRVQGPSFSSFGPGLLRKFGELGGAKYLDEVTLHSYAADLEIPTEIYHRYGFGSKPLWINEIGKSAYDFSPEYSAQFKTSEAIQAAQLMRQYAQSVHLGGPKSKTFWFCSYDPRNSADPKQWTWDSGIGILYLGFLPKMSYAALAAVAHMLDGRACLGEVKKANGIRQISFAGPVAVVAGAEKETVPAVSIGCGADEEIIVRDLFSNMVRHGRAGEITLDFSHGPLYVEGSRNMADAAATEERELAGQKETFARNAELEQEFVLPISRILGTPGVPAEIPFEIPPGAECALGTSAGSPFQAELRREGTTGVLTVGSNSPGRHTGRLHVTATRDGMSAKRYLRVSFGSPTLLEDGEFDHSIYEWQQERGGICARWDGSAGYADPGSMRLEAPFRNNRLVMRCAAKPFPGATLQFRCRVKAAELQQTAIRFNIAFFGNGMKWLNTTWCVAATAPGQGSPESRYQDGRDCCRIPDDLSRWTELKATILSEDIPEETTSIALFIDVNGKTGTVWLDDFDLWWSTDRK